MLNRVLRHGRDLLSLIGQLALGGLDIARVGIEYYKRLVIRSAIYTCVVVAVALALIVGGMAGGSAPLAGFGVGVIGLVGAYWTILATPIVAVAESASAQWQGLTRASRLVLTMVTVSGLVTAILMGLPEHVDFATVLTIIGTILFASAGLGLNFSRPLLVAMLLVFQGLSWAAALVPKTTTAVFDWVKLIDVRMENAVVGSDAELPMTMAVFSGTDSNAYRLFDTGGHSRWWCREALATTSGYRCFDRPGIDPVTGEDRVPLSRSLIGAIMAKLELAENEQAKVARLRAEHEWARVAAEEAAKIESDRIRVRDELVRLPNTPVQMAVAVLESGQLNAEITDLIRSALNIGSGNIFLPRAYKEGLVSRLAAGDPAPIRQFDLDHAAHRLILGTAERQFMPNKTLPNAGRYSIHAELLVWDTRSATILQQEQISVDKVGQTRSIAQEYAETSFVQAIQKVFTSYQP